ncbi:MAG: hypothetical protein AAFO07_07860 [Bacteroidota bacterium]
MVKNNWYIGLFLFLLLNACNIQPTEWDGAQEKIEEEEDSLIVDRFSYYREMKPSKYALEWGNVSLPMYQSDRETVFTGAVEMSMNDFYKLIKQEINLTEEEQQKPYVIQFMHRLALESGLPRFWLPYPEQKNGRLSPTDIKSIQQQIAAGHGLRMRIFSPIDSLDFYANVFVTNPFATYQPDLSVRSRYFSDVYNFQLIQQEGKPAILRIDTTVKSTSHVLDMYKDNKKFQILHIPGFETRRRAWMGDMFSNKEIVKTLLLDNPYDLLTLSEYVDYDTRNVTLHWGKMESKLNSENYSLQFFRKSIQQESFLEVGEKTLNLKNVHIIFKHETSRPERVVTSDLNHPDLIKRLLRLPDRSSVYLDRLVVEDEDGTNFHFPECFAFHIERKKDFEIEVTESEDDKYPILNVTHKDNLLQIKIESMPFEQVISYLLDTPIEAVQFNGFERFPYMDMYFSSTNLTERDGKQLLLTKLQQNYDFSVEILGEEPVLSLDLMDEELLPPVSRLNRKKDSYIKFTDDQGIRKATFKQVALPELAQLLAYDLHLPVIDFTNKSGQFDLELTYEDRKDLTKQLRDYGLALNWYEGDLKVLISKYSQ